LRKFPPVPAFSCLRLASPQDVPRMALVSTLGFRDSEIFKFERPWYDRYPQDTIASFTNLFHEQINDPNSVVIVAEDVELPEEDPGTPSEGPDDTMVPRKRVVVGVCSWVFQADSARKGQFGFSDSAPKEPSLDRDLNKAHLTLVDGIKHAGEKKYFAGMMICDKLVVHPTYWHRGHGSALLRWGMQLSSIDRVNQGVMPSYAGEKLFLSLGYQKVDILPVPGDEDTHGFDIAVAIYKVKK